jgi:hypothetical protein
MGIFSELPFELLELILKEAIQNSGGLLKTLKLRLVNSTSQEPFLLSRQNLIEINRMLQ